MLSTPPAFILSQDQTLNKSFFLRTDYHLAYCYFLGFVLWNFLRTGQIKTSPSGFLNLPFSLEFSGLHYCLFVKVLQSSQLPLQALFCFCLTRQLSYNNMFAIVCQQLFLIFFWNFFKKYILFKQLGFYTLWATIPFSRRWNFIIAHRYFIVNLFFCKNIIFIFHPGKPPFFGHSRIQHLVCFLLSNTQSCVLYASFSADKLFELCGAIPIYLYISFVSCQFGPFFSFIIQPKMELPHFSQYGSSIRESVLLFTDNIHSIYQ